MKVRADRGAPYLETHHLSRHVVVEVAVLGPVLLGEPGPQRLPEVGAQVLFRDPQGYLVSLSDVAHLQPAAEVDLPGGVHLPQKAGHLSLDLSEGVSHGLGVQLVEGRLVRASEVEGGGRVQEALGGHDTGLHRHHHAPHAQGAGQVVGMNGTRAPEGNQRRPGGVSTLLDDVHLHRGGHGLVDHPVYRPGHFDQIPVQGSRQALGQPPGRGPRVQAHLAAQEVVRVQVAQHQVRVGDGGLPASEAVADGPGVGPRALRADLDQSQVVDAGDAAAAGPDLDEVDGGDSNGVAAAPLQALGAGHLQL